jgi:hypothetical protein
MIRTLRIGKSRLKDLHLCPDMEHIELQDFPLGDQEVEDKIGAMKNLKELRVRSIKMPSDVTSKVLFFYHFKFTM